MEPIYGNASGWPGVSNPFRIDIAVLSQDPVNLTTTLDFSWYVYRPGPNYVTNKYHAIWSQNIDSDAASDETPFDITNVEAYEWYHYIDTQATVAHNADGTKTCSLEFSIDLSGTSADILYASGSRVLPAIPVQAEMYLKGSNAWAKGKAWIKKNGIWTKAKKVYIKSNGSWKEGV